MQKKKQIKSIIIITIVVIILLLIMFAEDIIKLQNKIGLSEKAEQKLTNITNEPNIPKLSAGMIPIKWNGNNWIITNKNDSDWYDYNNGKFAYIMLNDGVYQSELIRDMTNKKLAKDYEGNAISTNELGTVFAWIPRFAYKENGEIQYILNEVQLGGEWIVPDTFLYEQTDLTKPDFSLSGIWLQKDIDTSYSSKITEMQKEEGKYGFLLHTKSVPINSNDTTSIQTYVELAANTITDITNTNRIILKIVDTTKYEPIKANVTHNKTDQKLEIKVTYTTNGINSIVDEYGNFMTFTEENGIIQTDTGEQGLANGLYEFTIIDNKGNKKELSINVTVDSLFKVAYISGTDNIDTSMAYTKTQETLATGESTLLSQIRAQDTSTTYSRAIVDKNKAITAIGAETRTNEDEQWYLYSKYNADKNIDFSWVQDNTATVSLTKSKWYIYALKTIERDYSTGMVTLSDSSSYANGGRYSYGGTISNYPRDVAKQSGYYYWHDYSETNRKYTIKRTYYKLNSITTYSQGNFVGYTYGEIDKYPNNNYLGSYWYVRNSLIPKYTLYKYDENLNLKSRYDVDTKILTTESIDISNKGRNKIKLTLSTSGSNYKTYISNDNETWQEVTDIVSGTPKELEVDEWETLYIKIETNTSRIDKIDVAYHK